MLIFFLFLLGWILPQANPLYAQFPLCAVLLDYSLIRPPQQIHNHFNHWEHLHWLHTVAASERQSANIWFNPIFCKLCASMHATYLYCDGLVYISPIIVPVLYCSESQENILWCLSHKCTDKKLGYNVSRVLVIHMTLTYIHELSLPASSFMVHGGQCSRDRAHTGQVTNLSQVIKSPINLKSSLNFILGSFFSGGWGISEHPVGPSFLTVSNS